MAIVYISFTIPDSVLAKENSTCSGQELYEKDEKIVRDRVQVLFTEIESQGADEVNFTIEEIEKE